MSPSSHNVYLIISKKKGFYKGRYWKLIYKKNFKDKSKALKYEYLLKKNRKLRNDIKLKFIKNYG